MSRSTQADNGTGGLPIAEPIYRSRAVPRSIALAGALTLPFWLIGQTELLHMVVLAVALLFGAWRDSRRA